MRRITLWLVATVAVLALLVSYPTSTRSRPGSVAVAPSGAPAGPVPAPAGQGTGQGTVVDGSVAQTRWGPVQVQVTIAGGRIINVTVLQQPNGNRRDQEINAYAIPQLNQEVLAAQSARIDTVGGATVTSDGYLQSLQAALDAAHFPG
jgi:uncharacterized protein with FMN-binding domain